MRREDESPCVPMVGVGIEITKSRPFAFLPPACAAAAHILKSRQSTSICLASTSVCLAALVCVPPSAAEYLRIDQYMCTCIHDTVHILEIVKIQ